MQDLFLPTFHTFENANIFTGSFGALRFKITPDVTMMPGNKEVNHAESFVKAEIWHGLYCYEKSDIEAEQVFPLTPEGVEDMRRWLLSNA